MTESIDFMRNYVQLFYNLLVFKEFLQITEYQMDHEYYRLVVRFAAFSLTLASTIQNKRESLDLHKQFGTFVSHLPLYYAI